MANNDIMLAHISLLSLSLSDQVVVEIWRGMLCLIVSFISCKVCVVVKLNEETVWSALTLPLQGCWESSEEHQRWAASLQALHRSPCLELPAQT